MYKQGEATREKNPDETIKTWEKSIEMYDGALALNKDDEDAKFNREFVKLKLEELKKEQEQKKQDQQDQQNQDQENQEDKKDQEQQNQDLQNKDQQQQNEDQQNQEELCSSSF